MNKWDLVEKDGRTMDKMRAGCHAGFELYDLRPGAVYIGNDRPAGAEAV